MKQVAALAVLTKSMRKPRGETEDHLCYLYETHTVSSNITIRYWPHQQSKFNVWRVVVQYVGILVFSSCMSGKKPSQAIPFLIGEGLIQASEYLYCCWQVGSRERISWWSIFVHSAACRAFISGWLSTIVNKLTQIRLPELLTTNLQTAVRYPLREILAHPLEIDFLLEATIVMMVTF